MENRRRGEEKKETNEELFTLFCSHFMLTFWAFILLIVVDMKSYLIVLVEYDPLYACSVLGFLWFPMYKANTWIYF